MQVEGTAAVRVPLPRKAFNETNLALLKVSILSAIPPTLRPARVDHLDTFLETLAGKPMTRDEMDDHFRQCFSGGGSAPLSASSLRAVLRAVAHAWDSKRVGPGAWSEPGGGALVEAEAGRGADGMFAYAAQSAVDVVAVGLPSRPVPGASREPVVLPPAAVAASVRMPPTSPAASACRGRRPARSRGTVDQVRCGRISKPSVATTAHKYLTGGFPGSPVGTPARPLSDTSTEPDSYSEDDDVLSAVLQGHATDPTPASVQRSSATSTLARTAALIRRLPAAASLGNQTTAHRLPPPAVARDQRPINTCAPAPSGTRRPSPSSPACAYPSTAPSAPSSVAPRATLPADATGAPPTAELPPAANLDPSAHVSPVAARDLLAAAFGLDEEERAFTSEVFLVGAIGRFTRDEARQWALREGARIWMPTWPRYALGADGTAVLRTTRTVTVSWLRAQTAGAVYMEELIRIRDLPTMYVVARNTSFALFGFFHSAPPAHVIFEDIRHFRARRSSGRSRAQSAFDDLRMRVRPSRDGDGGEEWILATLRLMLNDEKVALQPMASHLSAALWVAKVWSFFIDHPRAVRNQVAWMKATE